HAVTVADHDQRGEAEATTTLHDLGDAVDRNHALEVRGLLLGRPATATVATVPAATTVAALAALAALATLLAAAELPRTSRHQAILPVLYVCIRTPARPRGPRRQAPRSGRGSRNHRGRTRPCRHRPPWPWPRPARPPSRRAPSCRRPPRGRPPRGW